MPRVFFCYRRDDSSHPVGRVFEHLCEHYGRDQLFKDVDSVPLGTDFRRVLQQKVGECDVLLAFIGDSWLTCKNAAGRRRLDDPADFVRIEIEYALQRGIPLVPVLIGNASIPSEETLPDSLKDLAFRHGLAVRPDPDFTTDIERLVIGIRNTLASAPERSAEVATAAHTPSRDRLVGYSSDQWEPDFLPRLRQNQTVRIGILKSGNASYVHDIEKAFTVELQNRFKNLGIRPSFSEASVEWGVEDRIHWCPIVNRLLARGGQSGYDYLVTIGTQATVALKQTLGKKFGDTPTLFLGVTYPKLSGIVDSEHSRFETKQVTGIRYGCGLDAVASLLRHRLFPDRQLVFIHQAGIPQDELAEFDLVRTRFALDGSLHFVKLNRRIRESDFEEKDAVYFSWYTFTRLFHEQEFSILANRIAVSIMEDNVRDGIAVAGTGTVHSWIGERGAKILIEHLQASPQNKPDWGSLEVKCSEVVYWLNLSAAKRFGISFSRQAIDGAAAVYE